MRGKPEYFKESLDLLVLLGGDHPLSLGNFQGKGDPQADRLPVLES
jgi:hypothetical protein